MFNFTIKKEKYSGKTIHDIGTVILLCAFCMASIVMANTDNSTFKENLLMVVVSFAVASMAAFGVMNAAVILAAVETLLFIGFKVYDMSAKGFLEGVSFLWILVPALIVIGFKFVKDANLELERYNEVMKDQINELIMIDEVTGLYNLRSMYMDIQTQISYAERNNKQICLMILQPRYLDELKKVLKKKQFEEVIIRLSKVLCDTVRLEDKVYAIDSEGKFGVILTCDREGSRLVEERLREKLNNNELYDGIVDNEKIRVEIQIGCLEHKEEMGRDAILFKSEVEAEVIKDF